MATDNERIANCKIMTEKISRDDAIRFNKGYTHEIMVSSMDGMHLVARPDEQQVINCEKKAKEISDKCNSQDKKRTRSAVIVPVESEPPISSETCNDAMQTLRNITKYRHAGKLRSENLELFEKARKSGTFANKIKKLIESRASRPQGGSKKCDRITYKGRSYKIRKDKRYHYIVTKEEREVRVADIKKNKK